jgi:DNA-binding NarL/FixJ family response regulator
MPDASRVIILADDLIWADRLARAVTAVAAEPITTGTLVRFEAGLPDADAAIVDLTARGYDGIEAVRRAAAAGIRVLAVGQHDDQELRRRARAAGAERVLAYRSLFEHGTEAIESFLAGRAATSA